MQYAACSSARHGDLDQEIDIIQNAVRSFFMDNQKVEQQWQRVHCTMQADSTKRCTF